MPGVQLNDGPPATHAFDVVSHVSAGTKTGPLHPAPGHSLSVLHCTHPFVALHTGVAPMQLCGVDAVHTAGTPLHVTGPS
jgi:hypothetical protein